MRVNVSARQLAADDLLDIVADVARRRTGLDPSQLCLEVTESAPDRGPATRRSRRSSALKALGVQLAVDDFGTGYSSLEYLRQLPGRLREDRPLVRARPARQLDEDVAIVDAVIELGHALGLSVTAEGVETDAQLGNLQRPGLRHRPGLPVQPPRGP